MGKRYLFLFALVVMSVPVAAQDAKEVLRAGNTAMGGANVKSITYSGTGWSAAVGQSYCTCLQHVGEGWPQFDMTTYTRTIDYDAISLKEEVTRTQGKHPPRGGGGTPLQGEQQQTLMLSGQYAWDIQGNIVRPAPEAAELRQLEIWLTPHGFLKAAMKSTNATAFTRRIVAVDDTVKTVTNVSFTVGKYRLNGFFTNENLLEYVQTWIPNPVLGDMLYEIRYTNYKDFGGVKFPTNFHEHTGGVGYDYTRGFWTLDPNSLQLNVKAVQPNPSIAAVTVPDAVRQAAIPPVRVESQKLAEGIWLMAGGTHNSVLVEFRDYLAIVEAPLNEARSLAVIAEAKRLVPNKPIEYVVVTHHHFDHIGGLRTYYAQGAKIIAQLPNREFIERYVLSPAPRTLEPDQLSLSPDPSTHTPMDRFETVTKKFVLSDGTRTMEIHAMLEESLNHALNMLFVYFPAEKILVNADMYTPPAPGAPLPAPNAATTSLYQNIQRLKLDVVRHVPIHGQVGSNDEFLKIVARPAQR